MKHVFLTIPSGSNAGLTTASIGLIRSLDRNGINAGFYKPFFQTHSADKEDRSTAYLKQVTTLNPPPSMPLETLEERLHDGKFDQLLSEIVETVEKLFEEHDAVVIEGLIPSIDLSIADKMNIGLASSLNAEVIIVTRPKSDDKQQTKIALDRFVAQMSAGLKRTRPAVILNKIPQSADAPNNDAAFNNVLTEYRKEFNTSNFDLIGVIPEIPELGEIRVSDLAKELNATIINEGNINDRRISNVCLCARYVENIMHRLKKGTLLVTPADRSDIVLAASLASQKGIELAGIVLTCNLEPNQDVLDFCDFDGLAGLPILKVNTDSYQTANRVSHLNPEIAIDDHARIDLVMNSVARHLDSKWLRDRLSSDVRKRLSPIAFKHYLSKKARKVNQRILLPEGEEERTLKAALECATRNIAQCILMGDKKKIESRIEGMGHKIPQNISIIEPEKIRSQYITALYERRKHKGMTMEIAEENLKDNILLATVMVAEGEADGLVAGAINSTAHTVSPALKIIKPAPGNAIVSSVFFMCLPDQVYLYGDCAVNPDPTAEQLAEIAIQSARSARAFDIEPKVAMISYSTLGSGSGTDVDKVKEATRIVKEREPELAIDGPLQYDAATILSVAQKKAPNSKVAGYANVLIFPDLNTGNTTYKAVQRSANVDSIGPVLQGLNKPVNDLSRGATVEDIVYTITVTGIQAGAMKAED
ncbi:phosphate acetyltransferase [Akkermansiaceae bacterium]|nr:phosphate acetyltransferase [Akkermansiaceae bacterium]